MKFQISHFKYAIVFCLLLFSVTVHSQDFEYGKPAELKGRTTIYIDVGPVVEDHDKIKDTVAAAKLSNVTFVTTEADADIALMFRSRFEYIEIPGAGLQKVKAGRGFVAIPSADHKSPRMLLTFDETQNRWGEKHPAIKFAKEFIRIYKKANDLK